MLFHKPWEAITKHNKWTTPLIVIVSVIIAAVNTWWNYKKGL